MKYNCKFEPDLYWSASGISLIISKIIQSNYVYSHVFRWMIGYPVLHQLVFSDNVSIKNEGLVFCDTILNSLYSIENISYTPIWIYHEYFKAATSSSTSTST